MRADDTDASVGMSARGNENAMKTVKRKREPLSQERLRQIAWKVGHGYPIPIASDYVALCTVQPRLGHLHWHIREESTAAEGEKLRNAPLVARVYDVTDIIFDGHNAHGSFDLRLSGLRGSYYFPISLPARNYLAEVGLMASDGSFHPLSRSNTVFFDRDRPSGVHQVAGLFAGGSLGRVFPVENIFDAPVYERLNRELARVEREEPLSVAVVLIQMEHAPELASFIKNLYQRFKGFGGDVRLFEPRFEPKAEGDRPIKSTIKALSGKLLAELKASHRERPFHLIHCHDWHLSAAGLDAKKTLGLPVVLSLHSTEAERTHGQGMSGLSQEIHLMEMNAAQGADLVIVPHSSTRQQVISLYGALPERVVIIPDVFVEKPPDLPSGPSEVKRWFGLNQDAPLVLFSGEVSHASGADLLADALPTVCRNHRTAQFVFAGDGPLRAELEGRLRHAGIGHRCRFLGDVTRETFEALLMASDFVVIPARTWQDEGLAQMAISSGRPVLTTHQAGINCVRHGENGLVTFDNPGSIVWGLQELLFNPLKGSMLQLAARKKAVETPSLQNIAAQHYMYYEMLLKGRQGASDA